MSWEFWIDRGGTFTDCIGRAPDGRLHTAKLLSSDTAAVEGIRAILENCRALPRHGPLPACSVKLGSTLATNALLERRGVPTVCITQRGLGDVFEIGTQERPDLFALRIEKVPPLHARVIEISGRCGVDGAAVESFDEEELRRSLRAALAAGIASAAVVLMHSYAHPQLEQRVREIALELGVPYVVASFQSADEIGFLARGQTACADAYLTPLLRRHIGELESALGGSRLRLMQSSGGLTDSLRLRGPAALLSGPAGGVVGAARVAASCGVRQAIGFDMGGTSTDVSLIVDGEVERCFESVVAGLRVKAPMLRIHTVAAGGGSLCRFDGFRLTVGPESAGADPGPLCYGRPDARDLALTDVNLHLGRLPADRFPLPIDLAPVQRRLDAIAAEMHEAGHDLSVDAIAAGFVEVANAAMAQAIQEVSVARGVDPRGCTLVGFGGAGGQHVCALARSLGMRTVLLHPLAGLLSAYGIGLADLAWDGQRDGGRVPLEAELRVPVRQAFAQLEAAGVAALIAEDAARAQIATERLLDLRYTGTETGLTIAEPGDGNWEGAFETQHRARFGYTREGRAIEIVTIRVQARAAPHPDPTVASSADSARESGSVLAPRRRVRAWFPEAGWVEAPVHHREDLRPETEITGPAIVLEEAGTIVVDPGFRARVDKAGVMTLTDETGPTASALPEADLERADPIRLEVFANRFMSIAEQMGAVLRNTAVSTNIKERLDYSCAVFDSQGGLVANAPHIPVHLGAMGETVCALRARFPDLVPGDVVATNDPFAGGSHLPDVTVVTPVFADAESAPSSGVPAFFVASRGHHADLGGLTPGSMPAHSTRLEDEGVLLPPFRLVHDGRLDEATVRGFLGGARYPARNPDDNVADLEAMVAANRAGERLLLDLVAERGLAAVEITMGQLQQAAAGKVAREIRALADGEHVFRDRMDDGTPICVHLVVRGDRMKIDFTGTGPAVAGNLNAPSAVVRAAVIYVLRTLVAERIPLNGGCLAPVEIRIPPGCLLDPPPGSAVVGGNVETSQRIVDVLLGALGRTAASQGTMNNVAFGNPHFGYYETIGGGAGAGAGYPGASGVHTHMTNTRITDPELLEERYPVRLDTFALRRNSGGAGRWRGGDGLVRGYTFLAPVTLSLLTERRVFAPYGQSGGDPGARGRNRLEHRGGAVEELPGHATVEVAAGDRLVVETPGGGGFGRI